MTQDTCASCRFWQHTYTYKESRSGLCRRRPPKVLVVSDERGATETCWPMTTEHEWCGEHETIKSEKNTENSTKPEKNTENSTDFKVGDWVYFKALKIKCVVQRDLKQCADGYISICDGNGLWWMVLPSEITKVPKDE